MVIVLDCLKDCFSCLIQYMIRTGCKDDGLVYLTTRAGFTVVVKAMMMVIKGNDDDDLSLRSNKAEGEKAKE